MGKDKLTLPPHLIQEQILSGKDNELDGIKEYWY